ncbi:MAG: hypothetical protein WBB28_13600 [Crinalium sp.]
MENKPSSSNQEEPQTYSQEKILTSENIKFSYNPISSTQNSPSLKLRKAQITEENQRNCNWTFQRINVVPYPQPDFQIINENLHSDI